MKKSDKIEELRAAADEAEQLKDLLDAVNNTEPLPASGTELILLEVDPHRAHAYWNIDPMQADPSNPLVLRVYDITESGNPEKADQAFDVEVQGLQGRWYLDFWRDDRTFVTEIGYRNPNGSLDVIARSNEVQTPPAAPVDEEVTGGHTDHNGDPLLTEWPGDLAPQEPPEEILPEVVDEDASESPVAKEEVVEEMPEPIKAEPITILEPDFPEAEWGKPQPVSEMDASADESAYADAVMAAGDASVAFDDAVMVGGDDTDDSESGEQRDAAPVQPEYPHEDFPTAEELTASITDNHVALQAFYESAGPEVEHVDQGGNEPSPNEGDGYQSGNDHVEQGAPALDLPPLEQVVGLSSMENAGKDVLLEVNAELHIYGRSKPNTELTLYGQVVKTRPDGTFSVRRMLPHGAVVLPLLYTKKEDT